MPKSSVGEFFEGLTGFTHEVREMAAAVGPGWGIAILLVVLTFLPHIGLVPHLARLLKEDRADARKQKVELERLKQKFQNRPRKQIQPPSSPSTQRKLPEKH